MGTEKLVLSGMTVNVQESLTVPTGVPLRLCLTKRIPKRLNAPVEAEMLSPIYARCSR